MQVVEVLINQVGVFVQQASVQHLHDEADGLSIQVGAEELGKHLGVSRRQQVSTGCHVSHAAGCV